MLSTKRFILASLISGILLLPVAHWKAVIFGVPFYSIELPITAALVAYGYGWRKKLFLPVRADFQNPFLIGITLFVGGALLSFFANPLSLTGLGMLKTWFVFPLLWVWLWIKMDPEKEDVRHAMLGWLGASTLGACLSLSFFFNGFLTYDGRLEGWYASPNFLAFFLAPGILLSSYFFLFPPAAHSQRWRILFLFSLTVLSLALFLTHSYTVWIAVSLGLFFFLFFHGKGTLPRRKKMFCVLLVAGILALFLFFESGGEKWQSLLELSPRSSLASRAMIWEASLRIIADHPVFGIGIGRFQETYLSYQQYFPPYLEWAVPQPHNLYLALWLQTGLAGLAGFVFLVSVWIARMMAIVSSQSSGAAQSTAVLLSALLILILVTGMTDTPFFKTDLAFMFWYCIAFGIGFLNRQKSARDCNKGASGKS